MIRKILKLKNVGLLQDATQCGAVTLEKVTAIYAENGRGKSTFATVLRACQLGDAGRLNARKTNDSPGDPEIKLLLSSGGQVEFSANSWASTLPDILIFDSEFVEQNVYSGFEVRADQRQSLLEFALGDQTVKLKQKIDQLNREIEAQTRRRTAAEKGVAGFAAPLNAAQFMALQPVTDAQRQIDALRKRIEAAKNGKVLSARQDPSITTSFQFDSAAFFEVLRTQLQDVEAKAEAVVRAHIAGHPTKDFEDWASRGQEYSGDADCPFCGQSVDGLELVRAYRSYFNESYAELKRRVAALALQVSTVFADSGVATAIAAAATNAARVEAWKDQLNVTAPHLNGVALSTAVSQMRGQLTALVDAKRGSLLESVGSESDVLAVATALSVINEEFASYNSSVKVVASLIADFKAQLASESTVQLDAEVERLQAVLKLMSAEATAVAAEYHAADSERKRLDGEKTKARETLDALMQSTLAEYQTSINELLASFGAEFSIEKLKPTYVGGGEARTDYGLLVRNKPVKLGNRADIATGNSFATALSEADKRTLALAFFVARLKAAGNIADRVVVFDDPVSSLDRSRRHHSIRQIVSLADACAQLIVLSHDAYFLRELRGRLADRKVPLATQLLMLKRVGQGYSAFHPCDIDDVCSSDYYRHHQLVADYVDGISPVNARDVAKAIRPMLEGYYHRRFPGKIPKRLMFGQIVALAAQAQAGEPLAHLHPILKRMGEVNDYAGQFHHDTNPGFETVPVVDGELLGFAKQALALIYQNG